MVRNGKEAEMRGQSRVGAEMKTSGAGSAPERSFDAPGLAALPTEIHILVARGAAVVVMALAVMGIGTNAGLKNSSYVDGMYRLPRRRP